MIEKFLSIKALILIPIIGCLIILLPLFPKDSKVIRRFAKGIAFINLLYSICLIAYFNPELYGVSYEETLKFGTSQWLSCMGATFTFSLDGFSILFVVLTCFITFVVLSFSKYFITSRQKLYYSLILIMQSSLLGLFCAKDAILFVCFCELQIVPLYFLNTLWSSTFENTKDKIKFLASSFFSVSLICLAVLILVYYNFKITNNLTANMQNLNINELIYTQAFQIFVFLCFLIGFLIRMGIFPFHKLFIDNVKNSPIPISTLIVSFSQLIGIYGLYRFNLLIFPEIFKLQAMYIIILSLVNLIISTTKAYIEQNIKSIVTLFSLSNISLILISICALNEFSIKGSIIYTVSNALIITGLMTVIAAIARKTNNQLELKDLGGLAISMPRLFNFAAIISFAQMNIPFLISFAGLFMIMIGVINMDIGTNWLTIVSMTIILLYVFFNYISTLRVLNKTFLVNYNDKYKTIDDISINEFSVLLLIFLTILFFGVFTGSIVKIIDTFTIIVSDLFGV